MRWRDVEPQPGRFADATTTYDLSADLQARHGLKVLQVFHGTPRWAVDDGESSGRYPADLRHAYRFCRAMASRYKGRVQAWEPWNEANVATFGGHTSDEMCSYQKAAYLGFKAGVGALERSQCRHFRRPYQRRDVLVPEAVSYTHLRAHETVLDLVCRLLLEKKKTHKKTIYI